MSRPRRFPDSTVLNAASVVVARMGPERFTLADVGKEVGLSAATLVQRFGSKRLLMLALLEQTVGLVDERFNAAIENNESPLDALYGAAIGRADQTDGPASLSNRFAFLMLEMGDPDFHALAVESTRKAIVGYKMMLDKAIEAGELTDGYLDTQQLAETIHAMTLGSLMLWAIRRDGTPKPRTTRDLDTLLRPFRRGPRRASSARTSSSAPDPG